MTEIKLSVALATPDTLATIRRTLDCLRAQTIRGAIELIVVAPAAARVDLRELQHAGFGGVCLVELEEIGSVGRANAAAVQVATGPVVALAEDHAYPEPGWAEALVRAHEGPWAAVGPAMESANPRNGISIADFLIAYGQWAHPIRSSKVSLLPGHNSSYKRHLLLAYGEELPRMLQVETLLHWDLCRRGHELLVEPAARVRHTNFERLSPWVRVQFDSGRVFGAARARRWAGWRRAAHGFGCLVVPALRLGRIVAAAAARPAMRPQLVKALPCLMIGLLADGAGQALGSWMGSGTAEARLAAAEFHRERYLARQ